MDARGKSVTELASSLLAGTTPLFRKESIVTSQSKLPPPRNPDRLSSAFRPMDDEKTRQLLPIEETIDPQKTKSMSLADAFAAPIGQTADASGAIDSSLNKGQNAYLEGGYTSALLHARDVLKKNPEDAEAWRLCSQAHFQLGETNEAEMTILEAIRHQPFDLDMRMDYLRIARETLPSQRYLQELEKVRDLFPESTEILWELARRYQMVENMPVTAAILYRKIIQIAPSSSAIADQAEIELIKLKDL
jgi:tetratricopeptide (TPR) repeat protein